MWVAVGLTGYTGPWKSALRRLRTSSWPTVPLVREAPMTATERGRSNRSMLRAGGFAVALVEGRQGFLGRGDVHDDTDNAGLEPRTLGKTGVAENLHHLVVFQERVGREPLEPVPAALVGQVLEQQGAQTEALVSVVDDKGHLGHVATRHPVVLGTGDELVASFHHQHALGRRRF